MVLRKRRSRKEAEASVLAAIRDLTDTYGYAPTHRDIGAFLGLATSAVHGYVSSLRQAGLVHDHPKIARTLRVTDAGRRVLDDPAALDREADVSTEAGLGV